MILPVINGHLVRKKGRVQKWGIPMNITYFNSYTNSISTIWNIPLVCRWCSCFFASLKRIFQLAMFDCQRYYPIFHWYSTNIPVVFHAYVLQQYTISPFNIYMSYSSNFFLTAHSCDSIPRFFSHGDHLVKRPGLQGNVAWKLPMGFWSQEPMNASWRHGGFLDGFLDPDGMAMECGPCQCKVFY